MLNDGPQSPDLHHNVAPSRENPDLVHSGMSVGEDLKNLASHYLNNPSSSVDKVRMRQSRSGAVKALILLLIDEQYAPAIPVRLLFHSFPRGHLQPSYCAFKPQEVTNNRPPIHAPLPHNIAGSSQGESSLVHSGISVGEDLKNLANYYLHNPGSHVNKLRMRRSRSGTVNVLILLEINDTM
jgi:hypothetical protein